MRVLVACEFSGTVRRALRRGLRKQGVRLRKRLHSEAFERGARRG